MSILLYHFADLGIQDENSGLVHKSVFVDPYPSLRNERSFDSSPCFRILWAPFERSQGRIGEHNIQMIFPFANQAWNSAFLTRYYGSTFRLNRTYIDQILINSQRTLIGTTPVIDLLAYIDNAAIFWELVLDFLDVECVISTVQPHSLTDLILFFVCLERSIGFITQIPAGMFSSCFMLNMTRGRFLTNPHWHFSGSEFEEFVDHCSSDKADHRTVYTSVINRVYRDWISDAKRNLLSDTCSGNQMLGHKTALATHYDELCRRKPIPEAVRSHYLFLHYQPEATTSPMAKEYADQRRAVRYIYSSLQDDQILVIKEHPYQFIATGLDSSSHAHVSNLLGYRSTDFYDDIVMLPNAYLLPRSLRPAHVLSDRSATVSSPTGTILLQAFLRNIPIAPLDTYSPFNLLSDYQQQVGCRTSVVRDVLGPKVWPMFRGLDTPDLFLSASQSITQIGLILDAKVS